MAAPATIQVFTILRDETGAGIPNATVKLVLNYNQATVTATGDAVLPVQQTTTTDSTGKATFTLVPTDLMSPANVTYTMIEPQRSYRINPLSSNGSPQQATASNVIVNPPSALAL